MAVDLDKLAAELKAHDPEITARVGEGVYGRGKHLTLSTPDWVRIWDDGGINWDGEIDWDVLDIVRRHIDDA
jgi:hypothetical protein